MLRIKIKSSDDNLRKEDKTAKDLEEMTEKECNRIPNAQFCYMHPDKEPSSKPKKNKGTVPTTKTKPTIKSVKPPVKAKNNIKEDVVMIDEDKISEKNKEELKNRMLEASAELRAAMLDYYDELTSDGVLDSMLKDRHFIRKFIDVSLDKLEKY